MRSFIPNLVRILHIGKYYAPHRGGIETYVEKLCANFPPSFHISVIVANDTFANCVDNVDGVLVRRVARLGTLASNPICLGLSRAIQKTPADIVHIHHPNPSAFLAYFLSRHSGKLVVSYHSDIVRQKRVGRLFAPLLRAVLNRSQAIIVASEQMITASSTLSPFRGRCQVVPFGIDPGKFQKVDPQSVAEIKRRHGSRIVLAVGRLVYYKGFHYLVRAMAKVDGRLLLIGQGSLRASLEREAQQSGVADRVIFLGMVPDIANYYQAADVFVLPSTARSEAFGIVQLEAMASGTPVINTALDSGVPFVSVDGLTGLTVPPEDCDSLANAINLLLDNPALRSRFGAAAKARVDQEFRLELMVRRTADLYRRILAESIIGESRVLAKEAVS